MQVFRDIVYCKTLKEFNQDVFSGNIDKVISNELSRKGIGTGDSQESAFNQSLGKLSTIFSSDKINQDYYCAIEYVISCSNKKRVDFMLSGYDKKNKENVIIIELKQWSNNSVELIPYSENLKALVSKGNIKEVSHPSAQANGYRRRFKNFYTVVEEDPIIINCASYLQNYNDVPGNAIKDRRFDSLLEISPTFLKTDNQALLDFVSGILDKPDDGRIFKNLDGSDLKPTAILKNSVNSLILNNDKLALFDSQEVAFNAIIAKVKEAIENEKKSVFIVEGGPGTGKSLVALKILGTVIKELGATAYYATHNSAVRHLFQKSVETKREDGVEGLLAWSGEWVRENRPSDTFDCLVVDEAHRLQKSVQGARGKGLSIIDEMIKSSKVCVFFIDEGQFVTYRDSGSIQKIIECAKVNNAEVIRKNEFTLDTQFRCNGSDGYLAFLDYVINGKEPQFSKYKCDYEFKVFSRGEELYNKIFELKLGGYNARFIAGYAYEWYQEDKLRPVVTPLHMPWNTDTKTWATRENGFNEVGCVFSAQGVEFDYSGVVIGEDMCLDSDGKIKINVDKHAKSDHTYMNADFRHTDENIAKATLYIKNAYKILMTRGIRGTFIYCEDKELATHLESAWNNFKKKYSYND